jgi:hypothetical protein
MPVKHKKDNDIMKDAKFKIKDYTNEITTIALNKSRQQFEDHITKISLWVEETNDPEILHFYNRVLYYEFSDSYNKNDITIINIREGMRFFLKNVIKPSRGIKSASNINRLLQIHWIFENLNNIEREDHNWYYALMYVKKRDFYLKPGCGKVFNPCNKQDADSVTIVTYMKSSHKTSCNIKDLNEAIDFIVDTATKQSQDVANYLQEIVDNN